MYAQKCQVQIQIPNNILEDYTLQQYIAVCPLPEQELYTIYGVLAGLSNIIHGIGDKCQINGVGDLDPLTLSASMSTLGRSCVKWRPSMYSDAPYYSMGGMETALLILLTNNQGKLIQIIIFQTGSPGHMPSLQDSCLGCGCLCHYNDQILVFYPTIRKKSLLESTGASDKFAKNRSQLHELGKRFSFCWDSVLVWKIYKEGTQTPRMGM